MKKKMMWKKGRRFGNILGIMKIKVIIFVILKFEYKYGVRFV